MFKLILDFLKWLNPFKHHKVIIPVPTPIPPIVVVPDPVIPFPEPEPAPVPPVVIPDPITPEPEPVPVPIPTPAPTPTLTSIVIIPSDVSLKPRETQQFTAIGKDQFGVQLVHQPSFNWSMDQAIVTNPTIVFKGIGDGVTDNSFFFLTTKFLNFLRAIH